MSKLTSKVAAGFLTGALAAFVILPEPVNAREPSCEKEAVDIYSGLEDKVVEVFAIGINPFRVSGRVKLGSGTGFLISDGYIVTNFHVIAGAQDIAVFAEDAPIYFDIVGVDPSLDIAVLRPWAPIGDKPGIPMAEGAVEIGQKAYAIGFPFHLGKTLSAGIVSGDSRVLPMTTSSWLSPFIQTDAAISPGNSGGPLVDSCGRLIGMVTAAISASGAENLGFAVPVSVLQPVLKEIIETGKVSRPWHGLYGQIATPPILLMLGIREEDWEDMTGFLVETVEPGSAADRAGLRGGTWPVMWGGQEILLGGDIITHVNGVRITSRDEALSMTLALKPGDTVNIVFLRDREKTEVSVVIEERPILFEDINIYRQHSRP